jgi:hypothetical protein
VGISGELFENQFLPYMVQACLVKAKELDEGAIRDPAFALEQGTHQIFIKAQQGALRNSYE